MGTDLIKSEQLLFNDISNLIDQSRRAIYTQANYATVLLFWQIGKRINEEVLENKRADYGKQIVVTLARQLQEKYGRSYEEKNLRRMIQFAEQFSDEEIVVPLARQLSWSHFLVLLPLKTMDAKLFYANEAAKHQLGKRGLREMISRKAFERKEISDMRMSKDSVIPQGTFKDPYIFDVLGLKDEYLEEDFENAVIRELEKFILEFGKGFAFVERQVRMIIDGNDHHLDILLFNRHLNRLVAIDLKQDAFEAADGGQMWLYLKWLNQNKRQNHENEPIGLILCAEGSREKIELMEMDKGGILVAEYWTTLPPKKEFEKKIHEILTETRERIAHRKLLSGETKDDNSKQ